MRLEQFQSAGQKPLGEGEDRKVFVDPKREKRIIAETKEGSEETLLQLKGKYYLTKIVHKLFPDEIPDIYQVGEARKKDGGKQTTDRERIAHTVGQEKLQEARQLRSHTDEKAAAEMIASDMAVDMQNLDLKLSDIGLGFNLDSNVGNYTRNEAGKVNYLESFKPWQIDTINPKELEVLFEEDRLREVINELPDKETRNDCLRYLNRLTELLKEEKRRLQEEPERSDSRPRIDAFNAKYGPYLTETVLAHLNTIVSARVALQDPTRQSIEPVLRDMFKELQAIKAETNITSQEYTILFERFNTLMCAFGTLRSDMVDHNEPY